MNFCSDDEINLIMSDFKIYQAIKNYRLMDLGLEALTNITERLNLRPLLDYFLMMNKSSAEYHNIYHSVCVALNCYEGAFHLGVSDDKCRSLIAAAIFHDFNHTGITNPDQTNVDKAIIGLVCANEDHKLLDKLQLKEAILVLGVTKYPYDRNPVTMTEMIIRDADLMQLYDADDHQLESQYLGLKTEIERTRNEKFTRLQYAVGQDEWLTKNVEWNTSWGKHKAVTLDFVSYKKRLYEVLSGDRCLSQ